MSTRAFTRAYPCGPASSLALSNRAYRRREIAPYNLSDRRSSSSFTTNIEIVSSASRRILDGPPCGTSSPMSEQLTTLPDRLSAWAGTVREQAETMKPGPEMDAYKAMPVIVGDFRRWDVIPIRISLSSLRARALVRISGPLRAGWRRDRANRPHKQPLWSICRRPVSSSSSHLLRQRHIDRETRNSSEARSGPNRPSARAEDGGAGCGRRRARGVGYAGLRACVLCHGPNQHLHGLRRRVARLGSSFQSQLGTHVACYGRLDSYLKPLMMLQCFSNETRWKRLFHGPLAKPHQSQAPV